MKYLSLLIVPFLFSCGKKSPVDDLRWLEGTWRFDVNPGDASSYMMESWEYDETTNGLKGKGFEIYDNDTTFSETLFIQEKNGGIVYRAYIPKEHGTDTVDFKLTTPVNSDTLRFENPANNFPSKITYIRKEEKKFNVLLYGTAEGTEINTELKFIRQ